MAARRPDGLTSRMLSRDLLSRRLHSLADERGVAMHHGRRLVTARYDGNRIVAEFDDGTATVGYVRVGADGLWSRTRTLIDPGATAPRYVPVLDVGGPAAGVPARVPPPAGPR